LIFAVLERWLLQLRETDSSFVFIIVIIITKMIGGSRLPLINGLLVSVQPRASRTEEITHVAASRQKPANSQSTDLYLTETSLSQKTSRYDKYSSCLQ